MINIHYPNILFEYTAHKIYVEHSFMIIHQFVIENNIDVGYNVFY